MNARNLSPIAVRFVAVALAVCVTTTLFSVVVSISEPQRSELLAQNAARHAANVAAVAALARVR